MDTISVSNSKPSLLIQVTGFLFFGFLFFLCWHFYKERMLAFDSAYLNFQLIETGKFFAGPSRYGDWVAEVFPWIALKMGMPLSSILIAHSTGFIVFYYAVFLFITLVLKNNGAGIALMLVSCLGYFHTFYFPMMQLHESLVLGVLLWALIHPETPYPFTRQKNMATIGSIITIFVMAYFHPLGIFVIGFVLGIEMIANKRYRDPQLWIIIGCGVGWFLLKFWVISKNTYDQDRIVSLSTIIHQLPNWKNWVSTTFVSDFTQYHFRSLKWITIICLLYSLRKGVLFTIFCVVFLVAFTLIYLGNFYLGAAIIVYENYYIMYGFFAGLLLIFLFYRPERKNLILLISIPLLMISAKKMYNAHNIYTSRVAYMARLIKTAKKEGEKKCIVDSKCYPDNYAGAEWNFAFETLLYSSLPGPDSTVSVFIKSPEFNKLCDSIMDKESILLGVHFCPLWFSSDTIPKKYFRLPRSSYKYLTNSQDDSSFHREVFSNQNVKIVPLEQTIYASQNDWVAVAPVMIENKTGHVIPAIPGSKNPVRLTCYLYDSHGKIVNEKIPTAFETDVKDNATGGIIIYLPREKGNYFIKPDIITGDNDCWNVGCPLITLVIK
jgi:hypothetical protein